MLKRSPATTTYYTALLSMAMVLCATYVRVDAECCKPVLSPFGLTCYDETTATPCCGYGGCNIFCCNCDGGCRKPRKARSPEMMQIGAGKFKWTWNCDFPGNDISNHDVRDEDCGELCLSTSDCNAFSHHNEKCYLKNADTLVKKQVEGGICGYIPWRVRSVVGDSRK